MSARHTWFPYAAAAAGAVLLLKGGLVVATDDGSPTAAAVLYITGLLLGLVVAVGAGLRRSSRPARFAVAIGGVLLLLLWVMGDLGQGLVAIVSDSEVLQDELPIALLGMALLGVAAFSFARDSRAELAPDTDSDVGQHVRH